MEFLLDNAGGLWSWWCGVGLLREKETKYIGERIGEDWDRIRVNKWICGLSAKIFQNWMVGFTLTIESKEGPRSREFQILEFPKNSRETRSNIFILHVYLPKLLYYKRTEI